MDNLLILLTICLLSACNGVHGGTFKYLGCWADTDPSNRDIKESVAQMGSSITKDKCASYCAGRGYPYAGLQFNGVCYCGYKYGSQGPSADCNMTCGLYGCGGPQANDVYYAVDSDLTSQRLLVVTLTAKSYTQSRTSCIFDGGDIVTPDSAVILSSIASTVNSSNSVKNVWVGLRRRLSSGVYEWADENVQPSYDSRTAEFASQWTASDAGLDCVSLKVDTQKLESKNCKTALPFACMQLPGSEGDEVTEEAVTDPPESISAESKRLALYIVLPLFICCYGGSCIIYCIHKIFRNCAKARRSNVPLDPEESKPHPIPVVVAPPPMLHGADGIKRPFSSGKRSAAVFPAPQPGPGKGLANAPPTTEMKPLAAPPPYDREEARRTRLLENAAREARERKQNSRPGTGAGPAKQPSPEPPKDSADTAKLLDDQRAEGTETPQGLAGMSINDIMKMKMAQKSDGKRKPRKIVSS